MTPSTSAGRRPRPLAELSPPADPTAILDHLPSGVIVVDRDGRPLLWNAAARRLSQKLSLLRPGIDRPILDELCDPHTGQPVAAEDTPIGRALQGLSSATSVYTLRGLQRRPRWVHVAAVPLRGARGSITGAVATLTDVTAEQRRLERRPTQAELEQAQQRLSLALEAGHMSTWDYDVGRDALEWSGPTAGRTTLAAALAQVHPDDRALVERAVRDALDHEDDLEVEARTVCDNEGKLRWVRLKGSVFRDEHGRPLRVAGVAMDLTERKEAEAARQMLAQSERLRALGQMASGIAHDLNQSLALISGYSDMARQELHLDVPDLGRVREMVEITARAALEGGQALKGLLSFARTQEMLAGTERVDVAEILREAARLTSPRWRDASQAEGRPIRLTVDAEPNCVIQGSPAALREALINLIFNAVDALPQGGAITLRARRIPDDGVQIDVSDTGVGIPPDVKPHIFDPFFTTKGERGTGLGLSQVLAIVERHGGTIQVDSVPGHGTTFQLVFPEDAATPAPGAEAVERPAMLPPPHRIRVLVVEDEEQLARMASLVLAQRGHQVTTVQTGEEAVARLEHSRFELIISDLGLGAGMNGWDLAQVVRERWPNSRFVLVTGWGAGIDPDEARERGVDQVIGKPYRIAELRQVADYVAAQSTRR